MNNPVEKVRGKGDVVGAVLIDSKDYVPGAVPEDLDVEVKNNLIEKEIGEVCFSFFINSMLLIWRGLKHSFVSLKMLRGRMNMKFRIYAKTHYEEFIVAVDELRDVLIDVEELKSDLASDNFRLQELLESYAVKKNVTEAADLLCTTVFGIIIPKISSSDYRVFHCGG